jgi:hypothetical protein
MDLRQTLPDGIAKLRERHPWVPDLTGDLTRDVVDAALPVERVDYQLIPVLGRSGHGLAGEGGHRKVWEDQPGRRTGFRARRVR